jgi:hypothetical protein
MSRLGLSRWGSAISLAASALLVAAPSYAGGGVQQCMDQAADHNGEPPVCTKVNGTWVASWPDSAGPGGAIPGGFVAFAVLTLIVGIGFTVWKVTTAQKLARQSGMDPSLATKMTLLTDDGLEATYLASSLRPPATPTTSPEGPAAPTRDVATRLAELESLLDRGLVTQPEYDARRQAIIDAV